MNSSKEKNVHQRFCLNAGRQKNKNLVKATENTMKLFYFNKYKERNSIKKHYQWRKMGSLKNNNTTNDKRNVVYQLLVIRTPRINKKEIPLKIL